MLISTLVFIFFFGVHLLSYRQEQQPVPETQEDEDSCGEWQSQNLIILARHFSQANSARFERLICRIRETKTLHFPATFVEANHTMKTYELNHRAFIRWKYQIGFKVCGLRSFLSSFCSTGEGNENSSDKPVVTEQTQKRKMESRHTDISQEKVKKRKRQRGQKKVKT